MSRKEEYKLQNEQFLEQLRTAEGIKELPCGILYRVLEEGRDGPTPRLNSVVSVHYKQPSAFLKFDVAKLGWETRENKKMASTTDFHKSLKNKGLQKPYLYKKKGGNKA